MGGNEDQSATAAILAAIREEVADIASAQQALADELAAAFASGDDTRAIVGMQAFDRLRQRLGLLGAALDEIAAGAGDDLAERVLARLDVDEVRAVFARRLGRAEAAAAGGGDVELF